MISLISPILRWALRGKERRFEHSLARPLQAQDALLREILKSAACTEYGQSIGLSPNETYASFCAKTPIVAYDDLKPWIERQTQEPTSIICAEKVNLFEKTSGSSGAAKHVPYPTSLRRSFSHLFSLWAYDVLENGPQLETGKIFLSISPGFRTHEPTPSGASIGLDNDIEYAGTWMKRVLSRFVVGSPELRSLQSPEHFKTALCCQLIAERELEVISVWNPSLLLLLLDFAQTRFEDLAPILKEGSVLLEGREFCFRPISEERLDMLERGDWIGLWPHLKLISCWTSAHAESSSIQLKRIFRDVWIQGKGLLATEAPITLPWIRAQAALPLLNEVFLEFEDDQGKIHRLHELKTGREYNVILTQKGGLLRYRIGDRVVAGNPYQKTPRLDFIGRADAVCDLVGEKLNESFVATQLRELSGETFQTLLPLLHPDGTGQYVLLTEQTRPELSPDLASRLDQKLRQSYHYRNARLLGQLREPLVCENPRAEELYLEHFQKKGMKWGDIKHQNLVRNLSDSAAIYAAVRPVSVETQELKNQSHTSNLLTPSL